MKVRFYKSIPVLMATLTLAAVAQFEVSPDHFAESVGENPRISNSHGRAEIEHQLATNEARLTGYLKQIHTQVASVEEARQKLKSLAESTERAAANVALQARQKDLDALRRSLARPIRYAKATIVALKTERKSVATAELRPIIP